MKQKPFPILTILRLLSVGSVFLLFFPLLALSNTLLTGVFAESEIFAGLFWVIGCGFGGFAASAGLSRLQDKKDCKTVWINTLCLLFCAIPLALTALLFPWRWATIAVSVFAAAAYFAGAKLYYQNYGDIQNRTLLTWMVVLPLGSIFFLWAFHGTWNYTYRVDPFVLVLIVYISICGVVRNQANIDYLMQRRKHKMEDLPKRIRYYNLLLLTAVFALLLFLFLAKDWIIGGLVLLWEGTKKVIVAVFMFFTSLFSYSDSSGIDPSQGSSMAQDFGKETQVTNSDWQYVFIALVLLGLLILAIKKKWFSRLFKAIGGKLKALAQKFFLQKSTYHKVAEVSEEYSEKEEVLSAQTIHRTKKLTEKNALKLWKKQYKRFMGMENGAEKYRFGYALSVGWLRLHQVKVKKADTPLSILEKAKGKAPAAYAQVTGDYNELRYAEKAYSPQTLAELEQTLQKFVETQS